MAMRSVPVYDAKNRLSEVLRGVESGEPVELTRHGKPVAVLLDAGSFYHAQQRQVRFHELFDAFCREWPAEQADLDVEAVFANLRSAETGRDVSL